MFSFTKCGISYMQRFFTIATLAAIFFILLAACTSTPLKENEFKSPSDAVQAQSWGRMPKNL